MHSNSKSRFSCTASASPNCRSAWSAWSCRDKNDASVRPVCMWNDAMRGTSRLITRRLPNARRFTTSDTLPAASQAVPQTAVPHQCHRECFAAILPLLPQSVGSAREPSVRHSTAVAARAGFTRLHGVDVCEFLFVNILTRPKNTLLPIPAHITLHRNKLLLDRMTFCRGATSAEMTYVARVHVYRSRRRSRRYMFVPQRAPRAGHIACGLLCGWGRRKITNVSELLELQIDKSRERIRHTSWAIWCFFND